MGATSERTGDVPAYGFQRAEKEIHSIVEVGGVKYYRVETWSGESMQAPLKDLVQAYAFVRSQDSLTLNIAITFLNIKELQKFGWSPELVQVLNTFRWYVFYKQMGSNSVKPAAQLVEEMVKDMPKSQMRNAHKK